MSELRDAPLISASRLLAERGFYGIVWADADFNVTARYGKLVEFVGIDTPLVESLVPLMGLEADLAALRKKPQLVVDIPSFTIVTQQGRTPRLNMAVVWSAFDARYLVLVSLAVLRTDLEIELNQQIRARLIAEADVSAKSAQLQRANLELERTNADLEQFACIISHDLKSPMRALRFLVDDAEEQLQRGRSEAALHQLAEIRKQALRMSQMLSGLLDYASAGRQADMVETVDTHVLVSSVVSGLAREDVGVRIEGTWPVMTTLAAPLDLVLRNLIDNAIAHHDRPTGAVIVSCEPGDDHHLFSVSDDGPGIPIEAQAAIFLPYRTLSRKADRLGMGLSLITRTLDAVGGSIEVISDPLSVRGTTFRIRWPKIPS